MADAEHDDEERGASDSSTVHPAVAVPTALPEPVRTNHGHGSGHSPVLPKTSCPYCQLAFDGPDVPTLNCERCGTHYHPDCWAEAGDCAIPGCLPSPGSPAAPEPEVVAQAAGAAVWPPFGAVPADVEPAATEPAAVDAAKSKRLTRRIGAVVAVIALVVLASVGTKLNWFSSLTGKVYSEKEFEQATTDALVEGRSAGYAEGRSEGYESGRSAGYDSGFSAGRTAGYKAGCENTLLALSIAAGIPYYQYQTLKSAC